MVCEVLYDLYETEPLQVLRLRKLFPEQHVPYGCTVTEVSQMLQMNLVWPQPSDEEYKAKFRVNARNVSEVLKKMEVEQRVVSEVEEQQRKRLLALAFTLEVDQESVDACGTLRDLKALVLSHQACIEERITEFFEKYGLTITLGNVSGLSSCPVCQHTSLVVSV
jgi:hypothetical protein